MLDSFIVSNTPSHVIRKLWGIEKPEMVKRHILVQDEDPANEDEIAFTRALMNDILPLKS